MRTWWMRLAAVALVAAYVQGASGQVPRRYDRLTADNFEEALKETRTPYQRQNNQFFVNLAAEKRSRLDVYENQQAVVSFTQFPEVTPQKVNDWNDKAIFSRAVHLGKEGAARLETDFDGGGGYDAKDVARYLDRTAKLIAQFAGQPPAKTGDAAPPAKGPRAPVGDFVGEPQTARVNFPFGSTDESAKSAWIVRYATDRNHGLRILGAWFLRKGENPEWIKVVEDVHVNHLYVPYMNGTPRYFDMDPTMYPKHGPWRLDNPAKGEANLAGPQGKILPDKFTVREDRDAGLLWLTTPLKFQMEKQIEKERNGPTFNARRQEMVLWGVYQASNYFYIMQYTFQNDGVVLCKLGSTGANLTGHIGPGHMHNALWRVHLDIAGGGPSPAAALGQHSLAIVRHVEAPQGRGVAQTKIDSIGREGKFDWKAEEFNFLRLTSAGGVANNLKSASSYELVPLRHGSARHFAPAKLGGPNHPADEFMHADFWITNDDPSKMDYRQLPSYVQNSNQLGGNPIIWLSSSNLHLPRDEDFSGPPSSAGGRTPSSATVMFSGFELRPRSVLTDTPYFDVPGGLPRPTP